MVAISDFFRYPDLLVFAFVFIIWAFVWGRKQAKKKSQNLNQPPPSIPKVEERSLAASVIGSFVTAGLTATSILIPASFVIIQIGLGNGRVPANSLGQVAIAFYWFVFSIGVGIFNAARFPTMVGTTDLSKDPASNIMGVMQLVAILLGVIRMGYAVSLLGLTT